MRVLNISNRIVLMSASILLIGACSTTADFTSTAQTAPPAQQSKTASDQDVPEVADCVPRAALDAYIQLGWERRLTVWDAFPEPQNGIVFLGSSIVQEGPWALMFPEEIIINRGIGADTTVGVLSRLDQVIGLSPEKVFLYIGGNDFSRLNDTPENAIDRLNEIVTRLQTGKPGVEIYIHTLLAREGRFAPAIQLFNQLLRDAEFPGDVKIIDVYPLFADPQGAMRPEFSNDNIHLSGEAYVMWADMIRGDVTS